MAIALIVVMARWKRSNSTGSSAKWSKAGFAGEVLDRGLAGLHRVQQISGNLEMQRIRQPDYGVTQRIRCIRAQQFGSGSQNEMLRLGFRENADHGQKP
jgi:hypothetical protein